MYEFDPDFILSALKAVWRKISFPVILIYFFIRTRHAASAVQLLLAHLIGDKSTILVESIESPPQCSQS